MIIYDLRGEKNHTQNQHNIFSSWSVIIKKKKKVVLKFFNSVVFTKTSQTHFQ